MAHERNMQHDENTVYNPKKPRGRATLQRSLSRDPNHAKYGPRGAGDAGSLGSSLSCVGKLWALLSFVAMGCACVGFYLPYWLSGRIYGQAASTLGVFRRCNYPTLTTHGEMRVVLECGRYASFADIPSFWWQVATVSIGCGCCISILVAFTGLLSCCMKDVLSHSIAKAAGVLQFVAAMCISVGCLLYPLGWDSSEVHQVCGSEAAFYQPGRCTLSWAYYTAVGGAASLLLCSLLSCSASKHRYSGYQL